MNDDKTGGPAYPIDIYDFQPGTGDQVVRMQHHGMTLLDYLAGQLIPVTMVGVGYSNDEAVRLAYDVASKMIEERKNYM